MANATSLTLTLQTLGQTQALGQLLGRQLAPGTVLLLEGDLGTGKTTLVQGLGIALGIDDIIVSPTFGLIYEYPEGRIPLYHFDLYRLTPPEVQELHPERYWEGFEMPLGITAIEWPDRLGEWPVPHLHLKLAHAEEGRTVTLATCGRIDCWEMMQKSLSSECLTPASQ